MTDLETMRAMLTRAGVRFTESPPYGDVQFGVTDIITIKQDCKHDDTNSGYFDFFTEMHFDATGALRAVGAWE